MIKTSSLCLPATCIVALAAAAAAQDGMPSRPVVGLDAPNGRGFDLGIVHVNEPGHPTNVVPGLGLPFNVGTSTSSAFNRPYLSPNTLRLGINVVAETATTADDDCLLVDGVVVLREGDAATFGLSGELVGTIDTDFGINDAGELLIGNNANGSAPSTADDYVIFYSAGVWTALAKEGDPITPYLPSVVGGTAGTWDDSMDTCRLLNDGTPMWSADGVDGLTTGTSNDEFVVFGDGTALQEGVDVPGGQAGGATEAWENFDFEDLYVSADGSLRLLQGDLTGSTTGDDVVTLNDLVIVQEGVVLAGSGFVEPVDSSGIVKAWVDNAGNFYVRGNNDITEDDWVYRNGVVVCDSTGTFEVEPGSGEFFDDTAFTDCFFAFDGNSSGAFLVGGVTDGPADQNGVLVLFDGFGNRRVVARESDPVDLDGNGVFDDDRFLDIFGNDDALLREDGSIVFVASLKDGAGNAVSNGLFVLSPASAGCTLRNGTGVNPVACQCATPPLLGTNFDVTVAPGPNTVLTFVFAGVAALPAPVPLFGGEALIAPPAVGVPGNLTHTIPVPNDIGVLGTELFLQGVRLDAVGGGLTLQPTNAQDVVVGF